jgi:hypothetical protein
MYRIINSRWTSLAVLAAVCAFLLPAGVAQAATSSLTQKIGQRPHIFYYTGSQHKSKTPQHRLPRVLYPHCGSGVSVWHVVATYKMERAPVGSHKYRTSTLYCGNSSFGFRHLEPHIGQYFGGWGAFNFSITQTQHTPASITFRSSNDTYTRTGPIDQCFPDHYIVWSFNVVTSGDQGARIITAFGEKVKTVNGPCPRSSGR